MYTYSELKQIEAYCPRLWLLFVIFCIIAWFVLMLIKDIIINILCNPSYYNNKPKKYFKNSHKILATILDSVISSVLIIIPSFYGITFLLYTSFTIIKWIIGIGLIVCILIGSLMLSSIK